LGKISLPSPSTGSIPLDDPVTRITDHAVVHREPVEDLRLYDVLGVYPFRLLIISRHWSGASDKATGAKRENGGNGRL
jgi:hypothetical protein